MTGRKLSSAKRAIPLVFASLLIGVCGLHSESLPPDSLNFAISLDKEKYMVNEPIWIELIGENLSSSNIYETSVNPSHNFLDLFVVSLEGDTLRGGYISYLLAPGVFPTIDQKEKDVFFLNILGPEAMLGIESDEAVFGRIIPVGRYTLQGRLRGWIKGDDEKVRFSTISNKLEFKVIEPQGVEKRVRDILVDGYKKFRKSLKDTSCSDWKGIFEGIIEDYPHSVYVDAAYERLYHIFDEDKARRFIDEYPNSGMVGRLLRLNAPKDKDKRKQFFEEVIKKYPQTKASACAQILLDKWRRGKLWPDDKID